MESNKLFELQEFIEKNPKVKEALQTNSLKLSLDQISQKLESFGFSKKAIQSAQKIQTRDAKKHIIVEENLKQHLEAKQIQADEIKNYIYILLTLQLETEQEKLKKLNSFIEDTSSNSPETNISIELLLSNFLATEIHKFTSNLAQTEKIQFISNLTRSYKAILLKTTTDKADTTTSPPQSSETKVEKSSAGLIQYIKQHTSFLEFIHMQGTHRDELLKSYSKKPITYIRQIHPELRSLKRIAIKDVTTVAQHIFQLDYQEEYKKVIKTLKAIIHNNNLTLQEFIQLDLQKLTKLPANILCSLVTEKQIQFISHKHLEEIYNQIKSKKRYTQIKYDTTSTLKLPTLSQIQEIKNNYTLDDLILSNIPSDKNFDKLFNYYPINKDENGYAFILSTIYNLPYPLTKDLRNNLNYIPDFIKDDLRNKLQNNNSFEEAIKITFQSHIPAELTINCPYNPSIIFSILKTIDDIQPQNAVNFYPIKKVLETITPYSKLLKILTIPIIKSQDLSKLKSRKMSVRMLVVYKLNKAISAQSPTNLDAYFKLKNLSPEDYPPQSLNELLTEYDLNKDNFLEKFYKIPLNIQILICYLKREEISIPTITFLYRSIFEPEKNIPLVTPPPNYKYDSAQLSPIKNDRPVDHIISEQSKQLKISCRHFFTEEYFQNPQNIRHDIKQIQQLKHTSTDDILNSKITSSNNKEIVVKVYLSEYASLQYDLNKAEVDQLIQSKSELIETLNELIDHITK